MYDLIICNGTICTAHESYVSDIGVVDGKIVTIAKGLDKNEAKRVINAQDKVIMPGVWHTHCHFRDPGLTYKEDFESGSKCAVAGGVTFVIDMTNNEPAPATEETFLLKKSIAESKSHVDFGIYGAGLYPDQVQKLVDLGAIGIKIFNTRHPKEVYPYISSLGVVNHGIMYELFEETAKTGLVCAVHHDDSEWVKHMVFRDYINKGKVDGHAYVEAYNKGYMYGHGMASGLASSLYLAKLAGVRLYVLHVGVMPEGAYDLITDAKNRGQDVYAELEACSFLIDKEFAERVGPKTYVHGRNIPRAKQFLNSDSCDVLVLEHAPHHKDEVQEGWKNNFEAPLGVIGVQEFLPLMLNEVNKGTLTLERLVYLTSEQPSKIFKVYPRKGAIMIGSDADFTIVDMNKEHVLSDKDTYSNSGWTTFDGVKVKGMPVYTIIRGEVAAENGKVVNRPGFGKMVSPNKA